MLIVMEKEECNDVRYSVSFRKESRMTSKVTTPVFEMLDKLESLSKELTSKKAGSRSKKAIEASFKTTLEKLKDKITVLDMTQPCESCNATGIAECDTCDGSGKTECFDCGGEGRV